MNCPEVEHDSIAEKYLLEELDETRIAAYEEHFVACGACFEELKTLRAIQAELRETGRARLSLAVKWRAVPRWRFAGAAAMVVALAGGAWIVRRSLKPAPAVSTLAALQPQAGKARTNAAGAQTAWLELASIKPPRYTRPLLRGSSTGAVRQFREAMALYSRDDYQGAIPGLLAVSELDRQSPASRFYLGISYLMTGETERAVDALRMAASAADSAYLEESRFYLAKALLRQGDTAEAESALRAVIKLQGDLAPEAQELLDKLALREKESRR